MKRIICLAMVLGMFFLVGCSQEQKQVSATAKEDVCDRGESLYNKLVNIKGAIRVETEQSVAVVVVSGDKEYNFYRPPQAPKPCDNGSEFFKNFAQAIKSGDKVGTTWGGQLVLFHQDGSKSIWEGVYSLVPTEFDRPKKPVAK